MKPTSKTEVKHLLENNSIYSDIELAGAQWLGRVCDRLKNSNSPHLKALSDKISDYISKRNLFIKYVNDFETTGLPPSPKDTFDMNHTKLSSAEKFGLFAILQRVKNVSDNHKLKQINIKLSETKQKLKNKINDIKDSDEKIKKIWENPVMAHELYKCKNEKEKHDLFTFTEIVNPKFKGCMDILRAQIKEKQALSKEVAQLERKKNKLEKAIKSRML